jgi:hypothetical protein
LTRRRVYSGADQGPCAILNLIKIFFAQIQFI